MPAQLSSTDRFYLAVFDDKAMHAEFIRFLKMSDQMRVTVVGTSGRMGQQLIRAVDENPETVLTGATERAGHDWVGKDLGICLGGPERGVVVSDDPIAVFAETDAVLDFTLPVASVAHAKVAADAGVIHVVGTTGLEPGDIASIDDAGAKTVVVRAGNMSLGVNLLTELTRKVASALGSEFDIEVVEMHHNQKIDAPSGTALMLGEAAADGRGISLESSKDSGRDGITGARQPGDIGFVALRGGDVVGEHDVIFAGAGERLVLRHIATDRMLFARGAVRAALWGRDKAPGAYSMLDVLGL